MLDGEVSQDCRGRGPPLWAWWSALWTELLEALTPVGCDTTSTIKPASLCDQKQNGGSLQMEVWSFFVQREFGIPSFRTAQGAYFQVEACSYLGPCGPFLVVDVSPVSRTSLKRRSPWAVWHRALRQQAGQQGALLTWPPARAVLGTLWCPCPLEVGRPSGARALRAFRLVGSRGSAGLGRCPQACVAPCC